MIPLTKSDPEFRGGYVELRAQLTFNIGSEAFKALYHLYRTAMPVEGLLSEVCGFDGKAMVVNMETGADDKSLYATFDIRSME